MDTLKKLVVFKGMIEESVRQRDRLWALVKSDPKDDAQSKRAIIIIMSMIDRALAHFEEMMRFAGGFDTEEFSRAMPGKTKHELIRDLESMHSYLKQENERLDDYLKRGKS
jgi:hypothetical protein